MVTTLEPEVIDEQTLLDLEDDVFRMLLQVHTKITGENPHPSSMSFYQAMVDEAVLHATKQKDYGSANDPFANVRASEAWGIPGWIGCMVRACDKVKRLQTFAEKGELANEAAEDSFQDLSVYSRIGLILFRQRT